MRPTRRALVLWAAGGLAAALPALGPVELWPLWLAWSALAVLALGLDALLAPRGRTLALDLHAPEALGMGDSGRAVLELSLPVRRTPGGGALPAQVTLDVGPLLEPVGVHGTPLGSEPAVVELPLVPRRRGAVKIEAAWVRYTGPLGLARRTVYRPLHHTLRVVPDLAFVSAAALPFFHARDALAGVKVESFTGDGSEFEALSDYRPGLDPRSIDWKASARHTRLLVREFRAERNHQVVLALDTGRLMAEPVAGAPLLDHAIHALLLVALVSLRHGDRVRLFPFAARPGALTAPRGGMRSLQELLRLTSDLEYSAAETNFTLALTELTARLSRRSLVLVMTDFADSITAELMVDNVLRLGRRHLVLFVAFRDPELERIAGAEPRSRLDLDRAVVAASLVREREEVLRRLAKQGVLTLDAPPQEVGPHLVRRYLEIKRREMIS